ncbi:ATP-binding protein [Nocardioides maradonensis]
MTTSYADAVRALVITRIADHVLPATAGADTWLEQLRQDLVADAPVPPEGASGWWAGRVRDFAGDRGPLGHLDQTEALLVTAAGLVEDDIRFGPLFAALQDPLRTRRPCIGTLGWLLAAPGDGPTPLVRCCERLVRRGLLAVENPIDPRAEWIVRVPAAIWDVVTGADGPASLPAHVRLRRREDAPSLVDLALSPGAADLAARLPGLVADRSVGAIVVRGMERSGRTTLLHALAAADGRDLLVYDARDRDPAIDPAWKVFAALATIAPVLPAVVCDPGPGATATLPDLPDPDLVVGVVIGRTGSVAGSLVDRAVTCRLDPCRAPDRERLWRQGGLDDDDDLAAIVGRFLLTPGNVIRAAPLTRIAARAAGRDRVGVGDVRTATRALRRQELETLATALDPLPVDARPVLTAAAEEELATLVRRCRHRERLAERTGSSHPGLNRGVRALISGPSGTGKTLAARYLAAVLELDLFRVDLAAVVNKYVGETERNLDRVLSRAEELDVVLLLDEGDALMTKRTEVANANDRYANLETNFLLQRLETFDGIVVVTSNASARIDTAFLRRIDVTVEFVPPEAPERRLIWEAHLGAHDVPTMVLDEVARRCVLTGGQIRNAGLHAALLALEDGAPVGEDHVLAAVRREYRRAGATCPLPERPRVEVAGW